MAVFVDSGVFIAAYRKNDGRHEDGRGLLALALKEGAVASDHVAGEVLTYIKAKDGLRGGKAVAAALLGSPAVRVLLPEQGDIDGAAALYLRSDTLSFCDALTVVLMRSRGIKRLYSFDSDFDQLKGVERAGG